MRRRVLRILVHRELEFLQRNLQLALLEVADTESRIGFGRPHRTDPFHRRTDPRGVVVPAGTGTGCTAGEAGEHRADSQQAQQRIFCADTHASACRASCCWTIARR